MAASHHVGNEVTERAQAIARARDVGIGGGPKA